MDEETYIARGDVRHMTIGKPSVPEYLHVEQTLRARQGLLDGVHTLPVEQTLRALHELMRLTLLVRIPPGPVCTGGRVRQEPIDVAAHTRN